jgi:hypothetical protein
VGVEHRLDERVHGVIVGSDPGDRISKAVPGWLSALAARGLARAGVRQAVLYERRLVALEAASADWRLTHRWAAADDVSRAAGAAGREPAVELTRLRRGARCFVTEADGRVVGFRWVVPSPVHARFLGVWLRVPDGDVWVEDSWTDPAERSQGVSSAATAALGSELAAEGAVRTLAIVMRGNRSGHAALLRGGYRPLGTLTTIRTLGGRAVRFRAVASYE